MVSAINKEYSNDKKQYIIIGADIVPSGKNEQLFKQSNILELIGCDLQEELLNSQFSVFNLESPITSYVKQSKKYGLAFKSSLESAGGLKALGINALSLSNNHIMDYGIKGLASTLNALKENEIDFFGIIGDGITIPTKKNIVFRLRDKKICVYSCCEHEFSFATEDYPGAYAYDPVNTLLDIKCLKEECDICVVLYHGGMERYRYPSPQLQKRCREFVDCGADFVLCQHSHCIGCEETYKESLIVYGQGNFLFSSGNDPCFDTGILIKIYEDQTYDYIPYRRCNGGIRISVNEESEMIMREFYNRSKKIQDNDFIKKEFNIFVSNKMNKYLLALDRDRSFLEKILDKLTNAKYSRNKRKKYYSERRLLALYDYLSSETHQEAILLGLEKIIGLREPEQ